MWFSEIKRRRPFPRWLVRSTAVAVLLFGLIPVLRARMPFRPPNTSSPTDPGVEPSGIPESSWETSDAATIPPLWSCTSASPSPLQLPSTSIGSQLPAAGTQGYEVSGAVWHPRLNKLFVVHDGNASLAGSVTQMDLDGTNVRNWPIGGDLEGITVADANTNFLYLAREQPNDSIVEFDFVRGMVTRTWDLTRLENCTSGCAADGVPFPDPPGNAGIEAIAFVPDAGPSGGVFYLGLQSDGRVYRVRADLSSATGLYSYLGHAARLGPWSGTGGVGVQGLDYDFENDVLWAMIGQERIRAMRPDGALLGEWTLPEPNGTIEGIAFASTACQYFVTWDDFEGGPQNRIRRYLFEGCTIGCGNTCPEGVHTRSISIPVATDLSSSGFVGPAAIQVRPRELQDPIPPNPPCCPPPDFSAFEHGTCTAPGEGAGCARWVGPPHTYLESNAVPASWSFRAARLQCSPYYHDWSAEGTIFVFGAEVVPSSCYDYRYYNATCEGDETNCFDVTISRSVGTRRSGDVVAPYSSPGTSTQPDAIDIVGMVNKFRGTPGAPSKLATRIQPNQPDFSTDVDALDIGSVVDAFRGLAYPFLGPCPCPSPVACDMTSCNTDSLCAGGLCIRTCIGGPFDGEPCRGDRNCRRCSGGLKNGAPCESGPDCPNGTCPELGSCPTTGFCRDRCGRCTP